MPELLRGRDDEIGVLSEQLGRLRDGHGSVTLIAGEAGAGKSRILAEALTLARRSGARTASSSAQRGDRVVPLNPLLAALFRGPDSLLRSTNLSEPLALPERRYGVLDELESLLEDAARATPLAIAVDDLQWADPGTVSAIQTLAVRLHDRPIAWIMAFRDNELSSDIAVVVDTLQDTGAARLQLGRLDDAAVAAIVADALGATPDPAVLKLAASARGTAFWLTELLRGLTEDGLIAVQDGSVTLVDTRLPARVRDTMAQRLIRMAPLTQDTAAGAAVLGARFTVAELADMLELDPSQVHTGVEDLVQSGLFIPAENGLAFSHDIVRDAVHDAIPSFALATVQRAGVRVRLAHGAQPVEVAEQLIACAQPGDSEAIDVLMVAAAAIAQSAPAAAADLTRRTLALTLRDDPRRSQLVTDIAVLLHASGRVQDGKAFADTALRGALTVAEESEVRYTIAGMFGLSSDTQAEAGRAALALPGLDPVDRRRHIVRLIATVLSAGRAQEAQELIDHFGDEIRAGQDQEQIFTLAANCAGLRYMAGDYVGCVDEIEKAARLGSRSELEFDDRLRNGQQWRGGALFVLDRYELALTSGRDALAAARAENEEIAIRVWEGIRGRQLYQLGELPDAMATLEGLFRAERDATELGANDAPALNAFAAAALSIGDRPLIALCARLASPLLDRDAPEHRRHGAWILARQAMAFGDPVRAHATLTALGNHPGESPLPRLPVDVTDAPQLVRLALAANDRRLAEQTVAMAQARRDTNPDAPTIAGAALHARGLLDSDADALNGAVAALAPGRRRPALASALEDAGVLAKTPADAVERLDRALALYLEMGATWDATRVRSRLRRLGVRRRQIGDERPATGWGALTDSEQNVMRLVAQGMTNREAADHLFVSPHTVSSHLRRVFAKLGVNSRAELKRVAAQEELGS